MDEKDNKEEQKEEGSERDYQKLVIEAGLADYSPVRGCMVIKPYGYALWENIQKIMDKKIKETGHQNAYFPLLIPEEFLKREKKHVDGFSPELAVVTIGGGKKLQENLVIRPTSETIIYDSFSKWIHSWRDLPMLINQWANVVRWEMRTRLFLRTTEFLWQEGHTAHATEAEAQEETLKMLAVYKEFAQNYLAMPVIDGQKSESEKFAGAQNTYSIEAMMKDKKALQAGTSHNLGQNFSKVFDIKFTDKDKEEKYVWQTSWGVSTRLIGGIVLQHSDERGLILPPNIAPIQVVMVPIYKTETEREQVLKEAKKIAESLEELSVKIDDRDEVTPGFKFNDWELKGVPLRLEIGPKDMEKKQVVFVRRDTREKNAVKNADIKKEAGRVLEAIQKNMFEAALKFMKENIFTVDSYEELKDVVVKKGGFARAHWCGKILCEKKVKEETKGTIRCIPFAEKEEKGSCAVCGDKTTGKRVIFSKAY
jgi:prolyl-tRNA synthetase